MESSVLVTLVMLWLGHESWGTYDASVIGVFLISQGTKIRMMRSGVNIISDPKDLRLYSKEWS